VFLVCCLCFYFLIVLIKFLPVLPMLIPVSQRSKICFFFFWMNQCICKPNSTEYITPVNTGYTPQTREQHSTPIKSLQPNQNKTAQSYAKPNANQQKTKSANKRKQPNRDYKRHCFDSLPEEFFSFLRDITRVLTSPLIRSTRASSVKGVLP
jgi:hypothetical protein